MEHVAMHRPPARSALLSVEEAAHRFRKEFGAAVEDAL
jgi:hypothetical protein